MAWRGGWRSIPPELGVPTAIWGGFRIALVVMPLRMGLGPLASVASDAQTILLLFGLLELRRRLPGVPARFVAVASGVQALAVVQAVLWRFGPVFGIGVGVWNAIDPTLALVHGVGLALALIGAARAWRSVPGPLLIAAALLADPPSFVLVRLGKRLASASR